MKSGSLRWPQLTARVLAGVFGAWALTWGFSAAGVAALVALGAAYHDAEMGVIMLAFLLFLGLFLWSFAAANVYRVWAVLMGGAAVFFTIAWAIQRAILA